MGQTELFTTGVPCSLVDKFPRLEEGTVRLNEKRVEGRRRGRLYSTILLCPSIILPSPPPSTSALSTPPSLPPSSTQCPLTFSSCTSPLPISSSYPPHSCNCVASVAKLGGRSAASLSAAPHSSPPLHPLPPPPPSSPALVPSLPLPLNLGPAALPSLPLSSPLRGKKMQQCAWRAISCR